MPRSCVVLGCGRSGTSLAAGMLAASGLSAGRELLAPDERNPKGFFEDPTVNALNEELLEPHADRAEAGDYSRPLRTGERWLAAFDLGLRVEAPPALLERMRAALPEPPFCCKDPRLCYTLDAWRPPFADALLVCVFRHPTATAESIAGVVRYGDLRVGFDTALAIWTRSYEHVLRRHRERGEWLFAHYDQLLDGSALAPLGAGLGRPIDGGLADATLARSRPRPAAAPAEAQALYRELCEAAAYPL